MSQLLDLAWSALGLIVFWGVGAAMFSKIEDWGYGDALYFNVVFCLSIGELD